MCWNMNSFEYFSKILLKFSSICQASINGHFHIEATSKKSLLFETKKSNSLCHYFFKDIMEHNFEFNHRNWNRKKYRKKFTLPFFFKSVKFSKALITAISNVTFEKVIFVLCEVSFTTTSDFKMIICLLIVFWKWINE